MEKLNREYHELLGWTRTENLGRYSGGFADVSEWWRVPGGGERRDRLPNLHEDANLCIAELDRVFDGDWAAISQRKGPASDKYRVIAGVWISEWGATFNEAALKALVAARKQA